MEILKTHMDMVFEYKNLEIAWWKNVYCKTCIFQCTAILEATEKNRQPFLKFLNNKMKIFTPNKKSVQYHILTFKPPIVQSDIFKIRNKYQNFGRSATHD